MVKNTEEEKIGKLSAFVAFDYVNCFAYPLFSNAVERACGKTCGQCGKVWVFNRYSGSFHTGPNCGKFCIDRCIEPGFPVYPRVTSMRARDRLRTDSGEIVLFSGKFACL